MNNFNTINKEEFTRWYLDPAKQAADIADKFNINKDTVYDWARRLKLKKVDRSNNSHLNKKIEAKKQIIEEYVNADKFLKESMPDYQNLIALAKQESALMADQHFTPVITENEIVTDKPIALVFTADWHLGSLGVDYNQFDIDINLIENTPRVFTYIGGDMRENIIEPAKIGSSHNQQPIIRQSALFIRTLEKIKKKVIAVGAGTHDWDILLSGFDTIKQLCEDLKVVYTDMGGLMNLRVGEQEYKIFRSHHYKFQSVLNLTHAAKQCWRLGEYDADMVCLEHRHVAAVEPFYGHGLERIAIRTGTYKTKDTYARTYGFYGLRVGNPTIILYPHERKMVPFLHMHDALAFLKGT